MRETDTTTTALGEIASAVSSALELPELLATAIRALQKTSRASVCVIYLANPDGQSLTLAAASEPHGELVGRLMLDRGEGITGWTADRGVAVYLPHRPSNDQRFVHVPGLDPEDAEWHLAVPLHGREGDVIGVVALVGKEPASEAEIGMLRSAATLVAGPIENARLLAKARRFALQQSLVADLGRRALQGADLDRLMDDAAQVVAEGLAVEIVSVLELLEDADTLLLRAGVGWSSELLGSATVPVGDNSPACYTIRFGEPVVTDDVASDPRFTVHPALAARGAGSGVTVVIHGRQRALGVLAAYAKERRQFDRDDVAYLQSIANVLSDAFERSLALGQLEETTSMLRAVVDSSPLPIIAGDDQARVTMWNPAAERLYGWKADEVVGRRLPTIGAEELHRYKEEHARLIDGQSLPPIRTRRKRRDGSEVVVDLVKAPVRARDGSVSGVMAIHLDRTEQSRAEEALRLSELRYRELVEHSPDMIAVLVDGTIAFANTAGARLLGAESPTDLVGMDFLELVPAEARATVAADGYAELASGEPALFVEQRLNRLDGTAIEVEVGAIPTRLAGRPAIQMVIRDISERKRAQEAARAVTQQLTAVVDSAPLAIFAFEPEGTITMWSRSAERMFGWTAEEVVGRFSPTIPEEKLEESAGFRRAVLEGRAGTGIETERRRRDGSRIDVSMSFAPTSSADGKITGIVVLVEDISERKRIEADRRLLEAQMLQTQKLESLGILAGGIAHDFNNLLMGVLGNASLLLPELHTDELRERAVRIQVAARRAADLTRQLLAYAGQATLDVAMVDLSAIIEEMTALLDLSIPKKVTVSHRLADAVAPVEGDATQLRQVVMNLITNAAESFGDRAGTIEIRLSPATLGEDELRAAYGGDALEPGSYVRLEIEDEGCGMDRATLGRIFDPFFTTKFTGRGLGLAAVHGIVRSHGGAITVSSHPGRGTIFTILFPAGASRTSALAKPLAVDEPAHEGKVLIVDDEEATRAVAGAMLQRVGYETLEAGDGREAVDIFRRQAHEVDLVLLDVTMPTMDGAETLEALRTIRPDVRALLMSGHAESDALQRFRGELPNGFIQKPYGSAELVERVRTTLAA